MNPSFRLITFFGASEKFKEILIKVKILVVTHTASQGGISKNQLRHD